MLCCPALSWTRRRSPAARSARLREVSQRAQQHHLRLFTVFVTAKIPLRAAIAAAFLLAAAEVSAQDAASCIATNNRGNDLELEGKLLAARAELARCANASCPKIIAEECAALVARVYAGI